MLTRKKLDRMFCYFVLFTFLEPPFFSYFSNMVIISKFFGFMRYILSAGFLFEMLGIFLHSAISFEWGRRKNYKTSFPIFFYSLVFNCILLIATYNNHTIYLTFALSCLSKVGFVAYNILAYHKMQDELFKCYSKLLIVYIVLNMFSQIIVPSGFMGIGDGRVWILGVKNNATLYLLLEQVILGILYNKYRNKTYLKLLILLNICTLINQSSTGIVVVFLFDIILFSQLWHKNISLVNKSTLLIAFLFIWAFYYFVICNNLELGIATLISNIFGKSSSFSGRTAVWALAIEVYKNNMIWGAGIGLEFRPWNNPARVVYSAHNAILEFLCKYGALAGYSFCLLIILVFCRCLFMKNRKISLICCGIMISLFLAMMFEAVGNTYIFWSIISLPYLLNDKNA